MVEFQFQFQIYSNNSSCHELHIHLFTNIQLPIFFLRFFDSSSGSNKARMQRSTAIQLWKTCKKESRNSRRATITILHRKYI